MNFKVNDKVEILVNWITGDLNKETIAKVTKIIDSEYIEVFARGNYFTINVNKDHVLKLK